MRIGRGTPEGRKKKKKWERMNEEEEWEIERKSERERFTRDGSCSAIGLIRPDVDTIARDRGREMSACHWQGRFPWSLCAADLRLMFQRNFFPSPGPPVSASARKLSPQRVEVYKTYAYRNDPVNDTGSGWYWLSIMPSMRLNMRHPFLDDLYLLVPRNY